MFQLIDEQKKCAGEPIDYAAAQQAGQDAAWRRIQQAEIADQARHDREAQLSGWHIAGRELLGYAQNPRDGSWRQRRPEQVDGLPAGLVTMARAASVAEVAAHEALTRRTEEASAYVQRHGLNPEPARVYLELQRAELVTAFHEAERTARVACMRLGEAAEQVNTARQAINSAPAKLQAIDQQAAALRRQVENEVEAARGVLLRLGVI